MGKQQKALQSTIDDFLEVCRLRGISSENLRGHIMDVCTDGIFPDSPVYDHEWARADKISAAGLTAQLSYLKQAWGALKLTHVLEETGGILDAIVRATSSDPEELAIDIGRDNIDENGDVV